MTGLVECVTILKNDTYELLSRLKGNGSTVESRSCNRQFDCPMFTIRKSEFDTIMKPVCIQVNNTLKKYNTPDIFCHIVG